MPEASAPTAPTFDGPHLPEPTAPPHPGGSPSQPMGVESSMAETRKSKSPRVGKGEIKTTGGVEQNKNSTVTKVEVGKGVTTAAPAASTPDAFRFVVATGTFYDARGEVLTAQAYSGHPPARNKPQLESWRGVGPIPRGTYIIGSLRDGGHLGPCVMPLTRTDASAQRPGFGRTGFYIHGGNAAHPAYSSDGCIILPRLVRLAVAAGVVAGVKTLVVE